MVGLPFRSGDALALRHFPRSSLGRGYTSVWHRDPAGRWTFYQDAATDLACSRYSSATLESTVVAPIRLRWPEAHRFTVTVGDNLLEWELTLATSLMTRVINATAGLLPEWCWKQPVMLNVLGAGVGSLLGAGRLRLAGLTPNGHRFFARPQRLQLVADTRARVTGRDLGPAGRLPVQACLGDFLIPQRGLFAVADATMR